MNKMLIKLNSVLREAPVIKPVYIKLKTSLINAADQKEIEQAEKLHKNGEYSENDKHIASLHNKYKGESCVIVGNGPSLRIADLEAFKNNGIKTFGVNRICELYSKTDWRPDFYTVHDKTFLTGAEAKIAPDDFVAALEKGEPQYIFFHKGIKPFLNEQSQKNKNLLYFRMPLVKVFSTNLSDFSDDITVSVSDLGNVTSAAIQIAYYLGFSKIYLYGQDFSFTKYIDDNGNMVDDNKVSNYAVGISDTRDKMEQKTAKGNAYADLRKMKKGFMICRDFVSGKDVEIINITRGGKLEIFTRMPCDKIIGE